MKRERISAIPTDQPKKIVIVMMTAKFLVDFAGPADVFNCANWILSSSDQPPGGYEIILVAPTRRGKTINISGIQITCNNIAMDVKGHIDTLLIAGNELANMDHPDYDEFYAWLSALEKNKTRRIGSICTGSFALAKAGLLNGRRATTHWDCCQRLQDTYPQVKVDVNAFSTQDGPIYTSGGVTSGIDLALMLVEQDHGKAIAVEVARKLVVFLNRPGFQIQFGNLIPLHGNTGLVEQLHPWISEHMHEPLDVVRMATHLSMSPRNFTRVFHKQTGTPPAKYIEKFRVECARKYLEDTDLNLELIAERCGLGSLVSMRRSFLRHLRTTPSTYRRAFQTSMPA